MLVKKIRILFVGQSGLLEEHLPFSKYQDGIWEHLFGGEVHERTKVGSSLGGNVKNIGERSLSPGSE